MTVCTTVRLMAATRLYHRGRQPTRSAPARPTVRATRPPGLGSRDGENRVRAGVHRNQNDDSQIDDLTAYGCDKIFTDTALRQACRRPELHKALAYLRDCDVLVITRLSRAMRSLKHLLALADELRERGAGLELLKAADRHHHADRAAAFHEK